MGTLIHSKGQRVTVPDDAEAYYLDKGWAHATSKPDEPKSETPDKSWKNDDLLTYAKEHSIDLGGATKKDDLLVAIAADKKIVVPPPEVVVDGAPVTPTPEAGTDPVTPSE
jgi:hypothetical protein